MIEGVSVGNERPGSPEESVRAILQKIEGPLAKKIVENMSDASLDRIAYAFNLAGRTLGCFALVEKSADVESIFEKLKSLTDTDDIKEAKTMADGIYLEIDAL